MKTPTNIKTAIPPTRLAVLIAILIIGAWGCGGSRSVRIDEEVPDTCLDLYTWDCGYNGDSVITTLKNDRTLIISGTGSMIAAPWYDVKDSITNVIIEDGVTVIGPGSFLNSANLTSVTLPNSVTHIAPGTFSDCPNLTSLTIDDNGKPIDLLGFFVCLPTMTTMIIPRGLTNIGDCEYEGCNGLTSITTEGGTLQIRSELLLYCANSTSITVEEDNAYYSSEDGVLFNKDRTVLIQYPPGRQGAYTIPDGVIRIERNAFQDCPGLTSVTIPRSVTSIGDWAFSGCSGLTSVIVLNPAPPQFDEDEDGIKDGFTVFIDIARNRGVCLYAPENSIDAYRSAWPFRCIESLASAPKEK
jgi:hypothetical protein